MFNRLEGKVELYEVREPIRNQLFQRWDSPPVDIGSQVKPSESNVVRTDNNGDHRSLASDLLQHRDGQHR